ncbi:MFS transporter [Pseudosporangium ferrugineum]|uniref:Fucose permease n=1 Tax=Pseudosporangium ferrugineum TaxID=439699 RepID=A0A2T0S7R8_9ACTN|nr:MFS transporter [Pseudosporangium ferrugineum]PRY29458.1 fucose permease [Pseudosporangium ferrugineum]
MPRPSGFRRSQLAIAGLFCFLGFQYSTWAARIPALTDRLDLSAGEVGVLLLAAGVGAAVSFPLVAKLMAVLGSRRLAVGAALVLVAALAGLVAAPNYPTALVVLLVDGVAVGCLNVAMNAQGAALEAAYERNTMAKLHALFSGGILAAALIASGVTALTDAIVIHFGVAGVLLLVLILAARPALLHQDLPAPEKKSEGRRWARPSRITAFLGLAMVFATITEGAMTDWTALYLKDVVHAAPHLLPLGIAVTSAMMVTARLFADGWRARWGDKRVVLTGATLAGAGLGAALLTGGVVPALAGFACVGLGMAAVSPCLYVAAARAGSTTLTMVAAMGTTGLLAGPPAIGFIAESSDLVRGMAAVVLTAWLVVLCVTQVRASELGTTRETAAARG